MVYIATHHDSVYAFDADVYGPPLWHVNVGPSAPTPADFGWKYGGYSDITVEVGITSTPVIDLASGTLYAVAFVRDPTTPPGSRCEAARTCIYHHRLHALDIATGAEKFGGPVTIAAQVPGNSIYESQNGIVRFNSRMQFQRPALLLSGGKVYVAFGGYADTDPFYGWIMAFNAATLHLDAVFCAAPGDGGHPSAGGGSIWQSGQGLSADAAGHIYAVTGNGVFDANSGGPDHSDSFLKLDGALSVIDWFTPHNQDYLSANDIDLGSTGAVLIPGTTFMVGGSKQGWLYLVNGAMMTHLNPGGDLIPDSFQVSADEIHSAPVVWNDPSGTLVYVWGYRDTLRAFHFDGSHLAHTHEASAPVVDQGYPGGAISLSASGSAAGTGILWAAPPATDVNEVPGQAVLRAYDAENVSVELWNSTERPLDNAGTFVKFNPPTIANGKVYLATASKSVMVYGIKPDVPASTFYLAMIAR